LNDIVNFFHHFTTFVNLCCCALSSLDLGRVHLLRFLPTQLQKLTILFFLRVHLVYIDSSVLELESLIIILLAVIGLVVGLNSFAYRLATLSGGLDRTDDIPAPSRRFVVHRAEVLLCERQWSVVVHLLRLHDICRLLID